MPQYYPRTTSRRNAADAFYEQALENQRREFERLLERQSTQILRDWQAMITQSLQQELQQNLRQSIAESAPIAATDINNTGLDFLGNLAPSSQQITGIFSQIFRVFANRPRITRHVAQTARSSQTQQAFRAAKSQQLLDLSNNLSNAERNR